MPKSNLVSYRGSGVSRNQNGGLLPIFPLLALAGAITGGIKGRGKKQKGRGKCCGKKKVVKKQNGNGAIGKIIGSLLPF